MNALSRFRQLAGMLCALLLVVTPGHSATQSPVRAESHPAEWPVSSSALMAESRVPAIEAAYRTLPRQPAVTVHGGSPTQRNRLNEALQRFHGAGLTLPDLAVHFHSGSAGCAEHHGLFHADQTPWRVDLCDPADWVYEHELAHAWMRHHLTDAIRQAFIRSHGYTNWSDHGQPWATRGVEAAATIIQQGLLPTPILRTPSPELVRRLTAFHLLTGRPSPRLITGHPPAPTPLAQLAVHDDYLTP